MQEGLAGGFKTIRITHTHTIVATSATKTYAPHLVCREPSFGKPAQPPTCCRHPHSAQSTTTLPTSRATAYGLLTLCVWLVHLCWRAWKAGIGPYNPVCPPIHPPPHHQRPIQQATRIARPTTTNCLASPSRTWNFCMFGAKLRDEPTPFTRLLRFQGTRLNPTGFDVLGPANSQVGDTEHRRLVIRA